MPARVQIVLMYIVDVSLVLLVEFLLRNLRL